MRFETESLSITLSSLNYVDHTGLELTQIHRPLLGCATVCVIVI